MNKKKLLLFFALIFIFLLVYSPHFIHTYPFHFDEWYHISKVARMHEQGLSYFSNQELVQVGFDIILLFISFFVDLIVIYQFLPAINVVIIAVILFYFLRKEFGYWVGLSSVIFLASLKSNINILGLWFYVPVIGAIVFDYLCLFFLEESVRTNKPKKIYLAALFLSLIAFIHQSSFLVIFLVILVYLCFNYKFVLNYKRYFAPFLILIIPALIMVWSLSRGFKRMSYFFSKFTWSPIAAQINYNPFLFYGILLSLFAIIGYYFCYKQRKLLIFRIYILIPLINLSIFPFTNFTVFSAYQRYIYHFMIAAIPLSAAGFYYIINYIQNYLKKYNKIIANIVIDFLIIFSFIVIFVGYYELRSGATLYYSIDSNEYEALQSLRDYPGGKVLAIRRLGAPMKAVSGHEAKFNFFYPERSTKLNEFYSGDCDLKKELLYNNYFRRQDTGYVHSKNPINCSFLKEIYQNENNSIYEVDLNRSSS
jgi:hypothetical protein